MGTPFYEGFVSGCLVGSGAMLLLVIAMVVAANKDRRDVSAMLRPQRGGNNADL